ncbi:hypothetical protein AM493_03765 [Flavobacterium akiainvivens]|uniref:Lipocalin-like domain-containing protein n=1 Tax=Flavobacterium akiainvivens TaxID=1202724 RepID=A0A0N0RQG0_9FLAO|nr:hypothetical protein [Flavobacterium akiainvivens]KOS05249.1 hypothetical protein AM493_03765 [Flavobacterium akiainvivens]SFQ50159.1 hypothetical protein SAMN05444144_10650 [Flavobacterium akiainvivens]
MKTIFSLFAVLLVIVACSDDDNNNTNPELVNTWRLTQILADPGDGSGTFTAVESDKTLKFAANGTVTSNGNLCFMDVAATTASSGTYNDANGTITAQCEASYTLKYAIENGNLIITYPCFEPCKAKFVLVE